MSFLFGGDTPTPAAVPASPLASEQAQRERDAAANAALSQQRSAGRSQTVSAGRDIAMGEQQESGTRSAKKRAARDIVAD